MTADELDDAHSDAPSGGQTNGTLDEGSSRPLSASEFTAERMLRRRSAPPVSGWRRGLYRVSGGVINLGPSAAELRERELIVRVKAPVEGSRRIVVISRKGGVGKTTTTLCWDTRSQASEATAWWRWTAIRTRDRWATASGGRRPQP